MAYLGVLINSVDVPCIIINILILCIKYVRIVFNCKRSHCAQIDVWVYFVSENEEIYLKQKLFPCTSVVNLVFLHLNSIYVWPI